MTTARILQLPALVANQIAAGEVVERPASVVKELLENSIDAKATKIEVEIEGGGLHVIRVRDNGVGIVKDDLILAFSRHATSKIATPADLEAITSMGFRGEALASIASVSRARLVSKVDLQESAWQIQCSGDLTPLIQPFAHPSGTTVEVADLFYNTPVRRKFLRSEKTEFQAIEEVIKRFALAFPEVSITLKHQQKIVRHYPKATTGWGRLAKVCGQHFADNAIEISMNVENMSMQGWLGLPSIARRQGDCQYFFVNQRMIKDRVLNHVIKTLYSTHAQMVEGTYPCYVLYLSLCPHEVDVNVHPTKQEVRFSQARFVHDFMSKGVQEALSQVDSATPLSVTAPLATNNLVEYNHQHQQSQQSNREEYPPLPFVQHEKTTAGNRYALIENEKEVVIIELQDPLLLAFYFVQLKPNIPCKTLLFPLRFKMQSDSFLQNALTQLREFGFHLRVEKNEVVLLQQPTVVQNVDMKLLQALIQVAAKGCNAICEILVKGGMNTKEFDNALLQNWLTTNPQRVVYLSHQVLEGMMYAPN